MKIDMGVIDINLKECEGFCIGEFEHYGCTVKYDKAKNKICSQIDFSKTKAEICSIVIFTEELDVSYLYKTEKKLVFDLKASDTICSVEVECRLKNRDVRMTVPTSADWENYSISLSEFAGGISEWQALKEIKFLLRRKDTIGGRIEIRNMSLS